MVDRMNSPAGEFVRELAAALRRFRDEAEAAGANARREAKEAKRRMRAEAEDFRDRARKWKHFSACDAEGIRLDGAKVAEAFRDAAIAGVRAFLDGLEDGLRKARTEAEAASDEAPPRRKTRPKPKAKTKAKAPKPKPMATKPRGGRTSPSGRSE